MPSCSPATGSDAASREARRDRSADRVDQPVLTGHPEGSLDVHAGERIECVVHHLRDDAAEMFDLAVLVRRALHRGEAGRDVADLLAFVTDALEIGGNLQAGRNQPQIPRRRLVQYLSLDGYFATFDGRVMNLRTDTARFTQMQLPLRDAVSLTLDDQNARLSVSTNNTQSGQRGVSSVHLMNLR